MLSVCQDLKEDYKLDAMDVVVYKQGRRCVANFKVLSGSPADFDQATGRRIDGYLVRLSDSVMQVFTAHGKEKEAWQFTDCVLELTSWRRLWACKGRKGSRTPAYDECEVIVELEPCVYLQIGARRMVVFRTLAKIDEIEAFMDEGYGATMVAYTEGGAHAIDLLNMTWAPAAELDGIPFASTNACNVACALGCIREHDDGDDESAHLWPTGVPIPEARRIEPIVDLDDVKVKRPYNVPMESHELRGAYSSK